MTVIMAGGAIVGVERFRMDRSGGSQVIVGAPVTIRAIGRDLLLCRGCSNLECEVANPGGGSQSRDLARLGDLVNVDVVCPWGQTSDIAQLIGNVPGVADRK